MRSFSRVFVLLFVSSFLLACQDPNNPNAGGISKQGAGTAIGVVAGGLLGSQFGKGDGKLVGVAVGALAGAFIGGAVGKSLDDRDRALAAKTTEQALEFSPTGRAVEWNNPDSGHAGSVTPTRTYKNNAGRYCREFTHDVVIDAKVQTAYGKACRQPGGSWQIVSDDY